MLTKNQAKNYYLKIKKRGTIYVWGMNYDTIITKESIDKAYKDCGTSKYNKAYYEAKLYEGKGRPGADCSGEHYKASGYDTTAQGYYNRCTKRGTIDSLPIDDIVLLFKGKTDGSGSPTINHTGAYLGNGLAEHMKSSISNCVIESVDKHGWTHWGRPDFIDYNTVLKKTKPYYTRKIKMGCKGVDVKFAQTLLNAKGYDCGEVDGQYGKHTKEAVMAFQQDYLGKRAYENGVIDDVTAKKLGFKVNILYYQIT